VKIIDEDIKFLVKEEKCKVDCENAESQDYYKVEAILRRITRRKM